MKNNIGILTLPFNKNIGGQLQGYALQEIIRQLGYKSTTITWDKYDLPFVKEYIKTTLIKNKNDCEIYRSIVNNEFTTIIVGSDQIWRKKWMPTECAFLTEFAEYNPSIFSYAASFGVSEWQWNKDDTLIIDKALRKFQSISVREEDGVRNLKDRLGIESTLVCDPTLLLDRSSYLNLCKNFQVKHGGIFTYILDSDLDKQNAIQEASQKLKIPIRTVMDPADVREWLAHFRDCDCIITDSYHGCLFSIIFNKPFICLGNPQRGSSRFNTLINQFNLAERFFSNNLELLNILPNVNYQKIANYSKEYLKANLLISSSNFQKHTSTTVECADHSTVICAIAKNENKYINDWVNWHLNLGFDHIYLFDNNDPSTEYVGNFIDRKDKVTIYDIRGIKQKALQLRCYNEFYLEKKNTFDWCFFCDIDEFLDGVTDIKQFLASEKFKNYDQIKIKWKLFSDNGLIERDLKIPVYEQFTERSSVAKSYLQNQSKAIVRGGIDNLIVCSTHFSAIGTIDWNKEELGNNKRDFSTLTKLRNCLPSGTPCESDIIIRENYSKETVFVNHYMTKSLKEFIDQKLSRGDACFADRNLDFDYYWKVNTKTDIKQHYVEEVRKKNSKLLHIMLPTCSPKEFFAKFLISLDVFDELRDYITFGIIFQPPYTKIEIDRIVDTFKKKGLSLAYEFKQYNGNKETIPLIQIRDDAASLNPTAKYYMNVDDDMLYTCSAAFLKVVILSAIEFMDNNSIGTVILGYPSHLDPFEEVRNDGNFHKRNGDAWASMGMILKNIYNGHIVPESALKCLGGNDDVLMADCRTYLNNLPCYYYGVALGHHTDIKEIKDRSMSRLNFKQCQYMEGSCRRYVQELRSGIKSHESLDVVSSIYKPSHLLINNISDYLKNTDYLKNKIIIISLKDSRPGLIPKNLIPGMNIPSNGAYISLIDNSVNFKYEKSDDKTLFYSYKKGENKINIISSGCDKNNTSMIFADKVNYSSGGIGLNFVVLDANTFKLEDIFRINPYSDDKLKIIRK